MIPKFEGNPGIIPNPGRESISAEEEEEEEEDVIPIIWAAPIWEQGGYEILLLDSQLLCDSLHDSRPLTGINKLFPSTDGNLKVIPFPRSMGTRA